MPLTRKAGFLRGESTQKCMTQTENPPDAVSGQKDLSAKAGFLRGESTQKCMTQTESPPDAVSDQKNLSV